MLKRVSISALCHQTRIFACQFIHLKDVVETLMFSICKINVLTFLFIVRFARIRRFAVTGQCRIQDFRRGVPTFCGRCDTILLNIPENCMKSRKTWWLGGVSKICQCTHFPGEVQWQQHQWTTHSYTDGSSINLDLGTSWFTREVYEKIYLAA